METVWDSLSATSGTYYGKEKGKALWGKLGNGKGSIDRYIRHFVMREMVKGSLSGLFAPPRQEKGKALCEIGMVRVSL